MADSSRIEDLRRRVQKDPASIAFAQLAEECRRAGNLEEAVSVAKAGLALHPSYLSARVTLGRTLLELNQLDDAQVELQQVLRNAPENLAALRALAETLRRLGDAANALTQYRAALALAKNDPDLQDAVAVLEHEVETAVVPEPVVAPPSAAFSYADPDPAPIDLAPAAPAPSAFSYADPEPEPTVVSVQSPVVSHEPSVVSAEPPVFSPESQPLVAPGTAEAADDAQLAQVVDSAPQDVVLENDLVQAEPAAPAEPAFDPARDRAVRTLVVLEHWLQAVHASRAQRHA